MSMNYQRLKNEDDKSDQFSDIELSSSESAKSGFTITILNKEKTYDVKNVSSTTKLSQLKALIAIATCVEVPQQRLIYAGRRLDGDEKPISEFKITSACRVHLFPIPIASAVSSSSVSSAVNAMPLNESDNTTNTRFNNSNTLTSPFNLDGPVTHSPIHFDEYVNQSSREVKLWSTILIFLSLMTLMDVFSATLSNARELFGTSILHTLVVSLNTVCSIAGLYVGQLGMNSARSLDLDEISKYTKYLKLLAIVTIGMRILWVFDVIQDVQKIVNDSHKTHTTPGTNPSGGNANSGGDNKGMPNNMPLDQSVVQSYTIQASMICFICAYAWSSCVLRGIRLQEAVHQYEEEHPGSAPVRPTVTDATSTTASTATQGAIITAVPGQGPVSATGNSPPTASPIATIV